MGPFFKGDKGKDYLKISNHYLQFATFRMETEEDENINKPSQIDNLTQQATRDNEVRPLSVVTVIGTLPRKPFVDNMN